MLARVTTNGGYKEFGVEREVTDGVLIRELQFESAEEIPLLLAEDDVESIEFEPATLSGYDAHLTVNCVDVL